MINQTNATTIKVSKGGLVLEESAVAAVPRCTLDLENDEVSFILDVGYSTGSAFVSSKYVEALGMSLSFLSGMLTFGDNRTPLVLSAEELASVRSAIVDANNRLEKLMKTLNIVDGVRVPWV